MPGSEQQPEANSAAQEPITVVRATVGVEAFTLG
jgi:hypothetical protein